MQQGPLIYVLDIPVYSPFAHRPSHISPVDDLAFAIAQVRIGVQDKVCCTEYSLESSRGVWV